MPFSITQQVIRKGCNTEVGTVIEGPISKGGRIWYRVAFGGNIKSVMEEDIEVFEGQRDIIHLFSSNIYGGIDSFAIKLTLSKILQPIKNTLYSYNANRTELHGYQYKPLLKYLDSTTKRLLIADEVGLGKTIEAGYILQEERARRTVDRILIVCPAGLRVKWQNEMWHRFALKFDILDSKSAKKQIPKNPNNPFSSTLNAIVSYESVRIDPIRQQLEEYSSSLDFLIVDEVHHCRNRETKNFKIVEMLAETSDSILFLSATPVHTGNNNLFNLLNLLLPDKFNIEYLFGLQLDANKHIIRAERLLSKATKESLEQAFNELSILRGHPQYRVDQDPYYTLVLNNLKSDTILKDRDFFIQTQEDLSKLNILSEVLTRTRKRDVHEIAPVRSAQSITTPFSSYEQQVYDMLTEHIYKQYELHYDDVVARFVLTNISRQIASSLVAAVEHYKETFNSNHNDINDIDMDDWEDTPDEEDHSLYKIVEDEEFFSIINSISCAKLREEDTKYIELLTLTQKIDKLIVFAFYKRSLRYLETRLAENGIHCVRIDGDVPSNPEDPELDERQNRILRFKNNPHCRILLSSQVGSEGLDFQFCDTVVNWDLPWNPMIVEQRIGRIDRLGQESEKIKIFNLVSKGSIEENILSRLYMRIGIFKESIGELEPILGPQISKLTTELLKSSLSDEERIDKIERSAQAVLRERKYMLELENEAIELLGHNRIIQEKMEKVGRLGRFISGEQLELFLSRFLNEYHPASALHDLEGKRPRRNEPGIRVLTISNDLRSFLAERLNRFNEEEKRFLDSIRKNKLLLSFDSEIALENPESEMIHSRHPLILKVAEYYSESKDILHSVFRLKLISDIVPLGIYFFGWAIIDEKGVFEGRYLMPLFLNLDKKEPIGDKDISEELLFQILIRGQDWEDTNHSVDEHLAEELYTWLDDSIAHYVSSYSSKKQLEAKSVILRQKQAINANYDVLTERRAKALETAKRNNRSSRIIQLIETQLKNLENERSIKLSEIAAKDELTIDFQIEGVGLVMISN